MITLKHIFLVVLCCFASLLLLSQSVSQQSKLDSLKLKFQKDSAHTYRFKKVRPYLAIDQRKSWISNERSTKKIPVSINGLQLGVKLFGRHTLGFGLYNIARESEKAVKVVDQSSVIRYEELYMRYATLFYEFVIINTRYFELDLPLETGLGRYVYNLKDESRTVLLWREEGPVKISAGGAQIIIKPFKWIGLSGMAGYRFVGLNKKTNLNFNGFYYSYGVWVDLRQIYRDVKFYGFKRPKYRKNVKAILASEG